MPRSPSLSLIALRKHARLVAVLALVYALIPRGYMPALAKAGTDPSAAGVFSFIICHSEALALPGQPGRSSPQPAKAPDTGGCPFAPLAGFHLVLADAPVIAAQVARYDSPRVPRHWTAPRLPFFPRPLGARAPPFSRA